MEENQDKYQDILYLPHHVSTTRPKMSPEARAAQFSPFAALTGYENAVRETARLTESQSELTEDEKAWINEKLLMIAECAKETPWINVTYFVEDGKKEGGSYETISGRFDRIDEFEKILLLTDGINIPIEKIRDIRSTCLKEIDER